MITLPFFAPDRVGSCRRLFYTYTFSPNVFGHNVGSEGIAVNSDIYAHTHTHRKGFGKSAITAVILERCARIHWAETCRHGADLLKSYCNAYTRPAALRSGRIPGPGEFSKVLWEHFIEGNSRPRSLCACLAAGLTKQQSRRNCLERRQVNSPKRRKCLERRQVNSPKRRK